MIAENQISNEELIKQLDSDPIGKVIDVSLIEKFPSFEIPITNQENIKVMKYVIRAGEGEVISPTSRVKVRTVIRNNTGEIEIDSSIQPNQLKKYKLNSPQTGLLQARKKSIESMRVGEICFVVKRDLENSENTVYWRLEMVDEQKINVKGPTVKKDINKDILAALLKK